jgi:hypothetical protein
MTIAQSLDTIPADWQAWLSYALMLKTDPQDLVEYRHSKN